MTGWPGPVTAGAAPANIGANGAVAHHLGGGGAIDVSLGRIVVSIVICLIIAVLAILLIRQRSGKIDLGALFARMEPRGRAIEIVETRRLSPHADICMVRAGGRDYLLVLQQGSMQVLSDAPSVPRERAPA